MEAWSSLKDKTTLFEGGKGWGFGRNNGFSSDVDLSVKKCCVDESKNSLRSLFNEVLNGFLKEISSKRCCTRSLPVLNSHGKMIDLFELFWAVRNMDGYDVVSRKKLWGVVAEECGVDFEERASLKLIYVKYLSELDRWLQKGLKESSLENGGSRIFDKLELLSNRLNNGIGGLLDVAGNGEEDTDKFDTSETKIISGDNKRSFDYSSSISNSSYHSHDSANGNDAVKSVKQVAEKVIEDGHDSCSPIENGDSLSDEKVIDDSISEFHCSANTNGNSFDEKVPCSHKRKRESSPWSEILNWLSYVAAHSDDPAAGNFLECSKKKERGNDMFRNQALLARKLLLVKKVNGDVEISHNQKYKMHPSMYEDNAPCKQPAEKSRSSQRLPPLVRCHSCKCHNSAPEHKTLKNAGGNGPHEPLCNIVKSGGHKMEYWEKPSEMHVFIGRQFQAEVPKWCGVVSASDSKWLGQRIWPREDANVEAAVELVYIGKGRSLRCDCSFPNSTECIRFHIAEKRLKLKRELNSVFYKWRFNYMGEEVSLSWTAEEEKKFKDMIKFYSASTNKFWRIASKCFPLKTREKLVSYYFNVFVLRRRSYQNRVTPKHLDSDDDEKDFGAVGGYFGHRAMCIADPSLRICSENKQRTDFE